MDISNGTISTAQSSLQGTHETHKHLKQERKLLERLKEAREAVARSRDRFQRAQDKLSRREARVARLERHLDALRAQLAPPPNDSQDIDIASANGHAPSSDDAQEATFSAIAPELSIVPEISTNDTTSPEASIQAGYVEMQEPQEAQQTQEAQEIEQAEAVGDVQEAQESQDTLDVLEILEIIETLDIPNADDSDEVEPYVTPRLQADAEQSSAEALLLELAAPVDAATEPEISDEAPVSRESLAETPPAADDMQADVASEQPVQAEAPVEEQASTPELAAVVDSPESSPLAVQHAPEQALAEAREEWNRANAAVHLARNRAQDMASSISTLVQTGLSGSLMEELLRKQAEANKALNEAQQHARLTYEQLVQAEANFQQQGGL